MRRTLIAAGLLLLAGLASAEPMQTALTADNTLYAIVPDGEFPLVEVTQRIGAETKTLIVPSTEDAAIETHPRLVWDAAAEQLFVVWHRNGEEGDEIRLATLSKDGTWSEPIVVSGCNTAHRAGLQVALTHVAPATDGEPVTTAVHIAWWKLGADGQKAEYALAAFENGEHVSTDVANLQDLAAIRESGSESAQEQTFDVLHPPLAMTRTNIADEVEVVFGAPASTALTRVKIRPKKIEAQTRMWRPGRSGGEGLPKAGLVSANSAPVQSFVSNGRIVLYTPDLQFRYVIYENGAWTPTRMIKLDEKLTRDQLLEHLRTAIDSEEATTEDDGATNE